MNYLAHFYLAAPEADLMVGNFIGDAVKGRSFDRFPEEVGRGIAFHRFIDTYTDGHAEVKAARKLFRSSQGKFSGVVVDVLFDHFLAIHWPDYHPRSLNDFSEQCYREVRDRKHLLPNRSERFFHYMVSNNILQKYATLDGIGRVLRGMDSRTSFDSNMLNAIHELDDRFDAMDIHFTRFFPDLIEASEQWKSAH